VTDYPITDFGGLHVMVVDAGSVIRDERTGEEAIVDDNGCVRKGSVIFCTRAVFDALKARIPERSEHGWRH
jgi:hypothetical protein